MQIGHRVALAIVDEQRMFLDGIESWLTQTDSRLHVVVKSPSFEAFRSWGGGPIDVVIVGIDQWDNAMVDERIAELDDGGRRVVVMSAFANASIVRRALGAGAVACVSKRDPASELSRAIESVVSGRDYLTPSVAALLLEDSDVRRPVLSAQETRVMMLYSTGLPVKLVSLEMGISQDTVRTYLKRIKAKYVECGIRLDSRVDFHLNAKSIELPPRPVSLIPAT